MEVQKLFDELKRVSENKESIFKDSGIINRYNEMSYGFFPLGLGVLTDNIKTKKNIKAIHTEIKEGGVMVLGNDFGTVSYADRYKNEIGETNSVTIINLKRLSLDLNTTFFTNFYLGVRLEDEPYSGTTMTKRVFNKQVNKLKEEYKKLCYSFFITQLMHVKPRIVICLGHDVRNALMESSESFNKWKPKSTSIKKLYNENEFIIENEEFDNLKFAIITHPCDLRNFKTEYTDKLNAILKRQ